MNIIDAINDPALFLPWFTDAKAPTEGGTPSAEIASSYLSWTSFLCALFALEMTPEQLEIFKKCTGLKTPPTKPQKECWLVIGRRGGKSFILSLIAVFAAVFIDYSKQLARGERGVVLLIAADKRQAKILLEYICGLLENVPMLASMIERKTLECIDLSNRISIEIRVSNYRTVRGVSLVFAAMDELAFWRSDDSQSPDAEVLTALKPAAATIPSSIIIGASSPYAKRGLLWDKFDRHYGKEDGPLVWHAPTRQMNPCIDQKIIDQAMEEDPHHAGAEWMATFRTDVEAFISREVVMARIEPGVFERKSDRNNRYFAFTDPSGGSSDSFTLAIGHKAGDTTVLDLLREKAPPFSPEAVIDEYAGICKRYRVSKVVGDAYAGEFPREQFRKRGVNYETSSRNKSQLYLDLLPLLMSGGCDLLDNKRLITQLAGLERKTTRAGRDVIDHGPGGHDDLANVCAGVLAFASSGAQAYQRRTTPPRVFLGYQAVKEASGSYGPRQGGRTQTSTPDYSEHGGPGGRLTGQAEVAAEAEEAAELIGKRGHRIEFYLRDNAGREKWKIYNEKGELASMRWGKAEAKRACEQLITEGQMTL